jgi:hypothetical protein
MKKDMTVFKDIENDNFDAVVAFFSSNPDKIDMLGVGNNHYKDKSPLMYALQCLRDCIADWLIDAGADVSFQMPAGPKTPALMYAVCELLPVQILEKMLSKGSNPNACDYLGEVPLDLVIQDCNCDQWPKAFEKLKLLLNHGADPNIKSPSDDPTEEPESPLEYALRLKNLPREVDEVLGIVRDPPNIRTPSSFENIIFDSTEEDCESYQQALWQGFVVALKKGFKHWLCVDFQGGTEAGIMTEPFYIKRRQFLVKFDRLQAAFKKHNVDDPWLLSITSDEDGFCKLPSQISGIRLTTLFSFVIETMYDLPKFEGDYNVLFEYDHDFHYYAYKNAIERDLKESRD